MIVSDWRRLPADVVAELYRRERDRWRRQLSWETASNWHTLETARTTWGLPGFVCRDADGRIRGWTFYLERDDRIEVGGFIADDPRATRLLVASLLDCVRPGGELSGFLYTDAPGLDAALAGSGVTSRPFLYLNRALDALPLDDVAFGDATSWVGDDLAAAASLLREAYGETGRIFARHNQLHEWEEYVGNLVRDPACGVFSPALSRVLRGRDRYDALAIVTTIGPGTAHLAQIAVRPSQQRRGVGQQLLRDVLRAARDAGCARMTLLVGAGNDRARALYQRMGFVERDRFLAIATEWAEPQQERGRSRVPVAVDAHGCCGA